MHAIGSDVAVSVTSLFQRWARPDMANPVVKVSASPTELPPGALPVRPPSEVRLDADDLRKRFESLEKSIDNALNEMRTILSRLDEGADGDDDHSKVHRHSHHHDRSHDRSMDPDKLDESEMGSLAALWNRLVHRDLQKIGRHLLQQDHEEPPLIEGSFNGSFNNIFIGTLNLNFNQGAAIPSSNPTPLPNQTVTGGAGTTPSTAGNPAVPGSNVLIVLIDPQTGKPKPMTVLSEDILSESANRFAASTPGVTGSSVAGDFIQKVLLTVQEHYKQHISLDVPPSVRQDPLKYALAVIQAAMGFAEADFKTSLTQQQLDEFTRLKDSLNQFFQQITQVQEPVKPAAPATVTDHLSSLLTQFQKKVGDLGDTALLTLASAYQLKIQDTVNESLKQHITLEIPAAVKSDPLQFAKAAIDAAMKFVDASFKIGLTAQQLTDLVTLKGLMTDLITPPKPAPATTTT